MSVLCRNPGDNEWTPGSCASPGRHRPNSNVRRRRCHPGSNQADHVPICRAGASQLPPCLAWCSGLSCGTRDPARTSGFRARTVALRPSENGHFSSAAGSGAAPDLRVERWPRTSRAFQRPMDDWKPWGNSCTARFVQSGFQDRKSCQVFGAPCSALDSDELLKR